MTDGERPAPDVRLALRVREFVFSRYMVLCFAVAMGFLAYYAIHSVRQAHAYRSDVAQFVKSDADLRAQTALDLQSAAEFESGLANCGDQRCVRAFIAEEAHVRAMQAKASRKAAATWYRLAHRIDPAVFRP